MNDAPEPLRRVLKHEIWDWFPPRLLNDPDHWTTAASLMPARDYDAVVRVLHPAQDGSRWAQIAEESGRVAHPLMQWTHIESRCSDQLVYGDRMPAYGSAPVEVLDAVLDDCPDDTVIFHGVWSGYAWPNTSPDVLRIPHREYQIFAGSKHAYTSWPGLNETGMATANLVWPANHSWVVATEIDWMFTLVACSEAVADALLADPRLEAYRVDALDDLSFDGDVINPLMPGLVEES